MGETRLSPTPEPWGPGIRRMLCRLPSSETSLPLHCLVSPWPCHQPACPTVLPGPDLPWGVTHCTVLPPPMAGAADLCSRAGPVHEVTQVMSSWQSSDTCHFPCGSCPLCFVSEKAQGIRFRCKHLWGSWKARGDHGSSHSGSSQFPTSTTSPSGVFSRHSVLGTPRPRMTGDEHLQTSQ